MKATRKLATFAAVAIASAAVAVGSFGAGGASAAGTEVECDFFNGLQWQCVISNPDGISHVNLHWNLLDVDLVDQSYPGCPTEVTIGPWGDHVAGDMTLDVEACEGIKLQAGGGDGGREPGLKAREPVVVEPKPIDDLVADGGQQFGIAVPLRPFLFGGYY